MPLVDVDRLKQGGQKFVSGFTPGQKAVSVLGVAGLAVAMFMFTKWSAKPNYAPLFSNLSAKDAGEITKALDGMKVSYRLEDGGGTVTVPQSNLYKARVDLSSKGLPANSDGYALLDKAGITTSEFTQHVNYQRAVQTELDKTIEAINGVHAATVNLALPSDDPFVGDEAKKATASVQVDTGGVQMAPEQVQAIVHLVSSSVKDLSPSGITVSDTMGHLLYSAGQDGSFTSSQNMSRTLAYQDQIGQEVEQQLATVLGPGHAAVAVRAKLDFAQGTTERTTNTPVLDANGDPIPGSASNKSTELTQPSGANPNTGGILGTPTTGNPAATTGGSGPMQFSETDEKRQNIVDQTKSTTQNPPFTVDSVSVSVALDQSKVSAAQLPALRNLIAAAVGINPNTTTSEDQLVVERTAMDSQVQKLAQESLANSTKTESASTPLDIMGIMRYVVTLLIVGLVLLFAWRSVKKAHASMGTMRVPLDLVALEGGAVSAGGHEYATALPGGAVGALGAGGVSAPEPREMLPTKSPLEMEVSELIDRQPEEVAQTLRSWLAERRS